jgi:hypothetical protein
VPEEFEGLKMPGEEGKIRQITAILRSEGALVPPGGWLTPVLSYDMLEVLSQVVYIA